MIVFRNDCVCIIPFSPSLQLKDIFRRRSLLNKSKWLGHHAHSHFFSVPISIPIFRAAAPIRQHGNAIYVGMVVVVCML